MLNTPGGVELPLVPLLTLERPIRMPLRYTYIVCCGRLTSTTTGPRGESPGFHQYSLGLSVPVGLPVGTPLVWNDGCSIAKELATNAAKMAMTDCNFIGWWGSQRTGLTAGVVTKDNMNVNTFQHLAVKLVVRSRPWPH